LALEPIGHITPMLKTKDAFNYFKSDEFPLILSLYDLIPILEHIEFSSQFYHYILQRQKFLVSEKFHLHDELDIFSYYQSHYLDFDYLLKDSEDRNVNYIHLENATDKFNDYYNFKFGIKTKFTRKTKLNITHNFKNFLLSLEKTKLKYRIFICAYLLDMSEKSREQFLQMIKKTRKKSMKYRKMHDFSLYFKSSDVGISYMIDFNKKQLKSSLTQYCEFKKSSMQTKTWIGIGDSGRKKFDISSLVFLS